MVCYYNFGILHLMRNIAEFYFLKKVIKAKAISSLPIVLNLSVIGNGLGGNKMDHSWMNALRTSEEYENGVEEFIEFARRNAPTKNGKYFCPCVNCLNESRQDIDIIRDHLLCDGINLRYTRWIWHGEEVTDCLSHTKGGMDVIDEDRIGKMIHDVEVESFA